MSSKVLLNCQAPSRTSDWRQHQQGVCVGICVRRRIKQRPYRGRAEHVCAALELQQSKDVSIGYSHDASIAPGAAVEVSHVSMAFGDRQVCLVICCFVSLSSHVLVAPSAPPHGQYTSMRCVE